MGIVINVQDGGDLQKRRADLQKRRHTPGPVTGNVGGAESNGRGGDLTNEVGRVEERGENGTLLGVTELSDQGSTGDDAEEDTDSEKHTGNDVHGDYLGIKLADVEKDEYASIGRLPCWAKPWRRAPTTMMREPSRMDSRRP